MNLRKFVRTVAYHVIGQKAFRRDDALSHFVHKLFFGNRFIPWLGGYQYFGQGGIDRYLKQLLPKNGYFLEIGSNDGLSSSNCKHFELFWKYRGILIEPDERNMRLARYHRSRKSHFVVGAVVPDSFSRAHVDLEFSNLMTVMTLDENDTARARSHADAGSEFLHVDQVRQTISAPALKLHSLLQDLDAPPLIDLLSLDIEGYELEVLGPDVMRNFVFGTIVIESRNHRETEAFMEGFGYKLNTKYDELNLIFVRDHKGKSN